jgi:hypothetical protein
LKEQNRSNLAAPTVVMVNDGVDDDEAGGKACEKRISRWSIVPRGVNIHGVSVLGWLISRHSFLSVIVAREIDEMTQTIKTPNN